jgi:hypothetical protein
LANDTYPDDGWSAPFDGSSYSEGQSGALVVISYDFEENAQLVVQWDVAIDDSPPVTSLNILPTTTDGTAILLSWHASDNRSRLDGYEIQYQMDGGNWQTWSVDVPGTQQVAWFVGQPGHVYGFRMRGYDMAGNLEAFPAGAETFTQIAATCSTDAFDQGAGDGEAEYAVPLPPDELQYHNFCGIGDVDWIGFFAESGQPYLIKILPQGSNPAGSSIDLFQSSESGWLLHAASPDLGSPLSVKWFAPADGLYLVRVAPLFEYVSGNNTGYSIRIGNGWWLNFPILYSN